MFDNLNSAIEYIVGLFEEINQYYVEKIAKQILKIGELSSTNINRLAIMRQMGADVSEINKRLQQATGKSIAGIVKIYDNALHQTYTDPRFAKFVQQNPLSDAGKARINTYVSQLSRQTVSGIMNYSNTTAVSETYRRAIDRAILATSSGMADYQSAMRDTVRSLGESGMQVLYESGYHRRLDTAVRQNIIDGTNQIAQHASLMIGEELGAEYDAVEISAHAMCAADHEPVQGRVFLLEEFNRLQSNQPFKDVDGHRYQSIKRPIGEWNCGHIAMSFSTQYSKRQYTDKQLAMWAADNAAGCTIDGRHYSLYRASQYMRQIETAIRKQKDIAVAAQAAGDDLLRRQCQDRINSLSRKYNDVAAQAGLEPQRSRTTVKGFKPIKIKSR